MTIRKEDREYFVAENKDRWVLKSFIGKVEAEFVFSKREFEDFESPKEKILNDEDF